MPQSPTMQAFRCQELFSGETAYANIFTVLSSSLYSFSMITNFSVSAFSLLVFASF